MTLDISFYSTAGESEHIDLSPEFYEWLAKSQFTQIECCQPIQLSIDGEAVELDAIELPGKNRMKFSEFLREAIVEESDRVLDFLGNDPSKEEYIEGTYKLKKLQEIRKILENEKYQYLDYVGSL